MAHETLARALHDARANTDALFDLVCPGAMYERPIPERHRNIFYLGHLEAFDWNLLRDPLGLAAFEPAFDLLFAFGIDPGEGNLPADAPSEWPRIDQVRRYGARVRKALDARLAAAPEQLLHVAIEHRLMHAETFAYMLHQLPYEHKVPPEADAAIAAEPQVEPQWIDVAGSPVRMGLERGSGFGQDNEFEAHTVNVKPFSIGRYKVTNGEYLRFVDAGAAPPAFWIRRGDAWFWKGMFAERPLSLDAPVYVTQSEAAAYASWKRCRLPSEAEWHAAHALAAPPDAARDNFDFHRWDPVPVTAGAAAAGPAQMTGNGWEWTSTPFAPFPGFEPFPFYPGYSANFFDGEHFVLKGASPRTAACMARPSFRNWFRPAYPYVYSTFRMVAA